MGEWGKDTNLEMFYVEDERLKKFKERLNEYEKGYGWTGEWGKKEILVPMGKLPIELHEKQNHKI